MAGTSSGILVVLFAYAGGAHAQSVPASSSSTGGLEEIVVTAQRRSENLQTVPITVSTLDASSLSNLGAGSTRDLASVVPGLVLNQSITNVTPFLRGIGQTSGAPGLEPSVSFYLDGVYFPTGGATVFSLNNVSQVAVLKGPQGTLFGRNSTGGVIQVTTRSPSKAFEADWDVGYGRFDTVQGHFYVSGPISENIRTSLAVTGMNQADGWGRNITTGKEVFKRRELGAQSKTEFSFDQTDLTINLLYTKNKGDTGTTLSAAPGSRGADGILRRQGEYDALPSVDSGFEMEQGMVSLTLDHDLGWATMKAIGSYQRYDDKSTIVQNGLPFGSGRALLFSPLGSTGKTFSGELQLQSPDTSTLHWILGLYAFRDRTSNHYSVSLDATAQYRQISSQLSTSYAVFGQVSGEIASNTNLTVGARYTIDEKNLAGTQYTPSGAVLRTFEAIAAAGRFPTDRTWKEPTVRISIDHRLNDNAMLFASYNRGFKSGLFNLITLNNPPADPEKLDAFEVGGKTMFFDRRLRLNASAFYYKYKGLHIRTVRDDGSIALYNATDAKIKGLDVDVTAALIDGLELNAGFEYLDAKYGRFPLGLCTEPLPTGGNRSFRCDRSGAQLQRAPKFTSVLGVTYTASLKVGGKITIAANDNYNSGFPWEVSGRLRQQSYHNVSASIKWSADNDKIYARIWGANLADEHIRSVVGEGAGDVISPGAPRTYGITVGGSF